MQVTIGLLAVGEPEAMAAIDEAIATLRPNQPSWHVDMGRAATTRTIQIQLQARGLDEGLEAVKAAIDLHLSKTTLAPAPELRWARPRQVPL